MVDAIRTDYERLLQIGLDNLGVKYLINRIYCFICRKHFNWSKSETPEFCPLGNHKWTEKGVFARPDFLIIDEDNSVIAVIRVDGPIHDRKSQRIFDRFQAQNFLDVDIKVFVFRNEWLLGAQHIVSKKQKKWFPIQFPDFIYTALALVVVLCCRDDQAYLKYLSDREVKHYLGL